MFVDSQGLTNIDKMLWTAQIPALTSQLLTANRLGLARRTADDSNALFSSFCSW